MLNNKKIIALCMSRVYDRDCNILIQSLSENLKKIGCKLFVYSTCSDLYWDHSSEAGEASIFDLMNYDIIDTVIIYSEKLASESVRERIFSDAERNNVPVIYIGGASERGISVRFDYEAGFEHIVRHVMEKHNVRRVHFVAGFRNNEFSESRINVFKNVMSEYGINVTGDMISYGDFWSGPAERAAQSLIDSGNIPEAVICANDVMAIAVSNVFKRNGYRIPDDVIITGMDGIDEIYFSTPKITSCECRFSDISDKIAEILPDVLDRKLEKGDFSILPSLILSQSCGCSEGKSINAAEYLNLIGDRLNRFQGEDHDLSRIAIKIQMSDTLEKAAGEIEKNLTYGMCCLLTENCIDETVNPMNAGNEKGFGEKMWLFYDYHEAYHSENGFVPRMFDSKDIIPHLDEKMEDEYPLIFSAINLLNVPLGYACFHYQSYSLSNYAKIPQTVDFLNSAISGFINVHHQRYLNSQIEEMYKSDALTKLCNRNGFSKEYDELVRSLEGEEKISVILADLDGLKKINDNYGHGEGDNAIYTVAEAIRSVFPGNAVCGRFGGDEMIAVTKLTVDETEIRAAFERFFEKYNKSSGKPYKVSASIGIYTAEKDGVTDFEALFKEADKKMYAEKLKRKG